MSTVTIELNELKKLVEPESELMNADEVAEYLRKDNKRAFTEYIAPLPDFPKPAKIPTTRATKKITQLLWYRNEVKQWVASQRK